MGQKPISRVTRRTVLKTCGSAIALGGMGSALGRDIDRSEKVKSITKQAARIEKRTGSHEEAMTFLRNHSLSYGQTTVETHGSLKGGSPDGDLISPHKLGKSDVDTTLTFTACHLPDHEGPVSINYNIDIDCNWNNHGGAGKDGILITWPSEFYYLEDDSWSTTLDAAEFQDATAHSYVAWEFADAGAIGLPGSSTEGGVYCTLNQQPTDKTRNLTGKYQHTWEDCEISSVTVSTDGSASFTVTDAEYSSVLDTDFLEDS